MASFPTRAEVEAYIRQSAQSRGIDPSIAVQVAASEGLGADPTEAWQSRVVDEGRREPSYGPFQLLVGGPGTGFPAGMGNDFVQQTGLDPRNAGTWRQQVDFALNQAAEGGWSPWYGAAKVGVSRWEGVKGANPADIGAMAAMPASGGSTQPPRMEVASSSQTPAPGSPAPPLDPPVNVPTMGVKPFQGDAPMPSMPGPKPEGGGNDMMKMMAMMGAMQPQPVQFAPVQIMGPTQQQSAGLSNLVQSLRQRSMAG